jgi:hypothetical protein
MEEALWLHHAVLAIAREGGDRNGEAATLSQPAHLHRVQGRMVPPSRCFASLCATRGSCAFPIPTLRP